MRVFSALFEWRDKICREEDESTGYVLPKAQLVMLTQEMPGGLEKNTSRAVEWMIMFLFVVVTMGFRSL